MSVIDGLNRFAKAIPGLNKSRSSFDRNSTLKTTFKEGDIVPIYLDEMLPGDTFNMKTSFVLRNLTPAVPVMDNAFIDIFYFFVPNRIIATQVGDNWKAIMGENVSGYWAQEEQPNISLGRPDGVPGDFVVENHSVMNYFGFPIGFDVSDSYLNYYPLVGYAMIYDRYFRDENVEAPVMSKAGGIDMMNFLERTKFWESDSCFKARKFADLFVSCLPAPQKGETVSIGLSGEAPVTGSAEVAAIGSLHDAGTVKFFIKDFEPNESLHDITFDKDGTMRATSAGQTSPSGTIINQTNLGISSSIGTGYFNLSANLSEASAVTINQLRLATQLQKFYERLARTGSRYAEYLLASFGVKAPAGLLDEPEVLGGFRQPINITQVLSTTQNEESVVGFTGAFSNTFAQHHDFVYSAKEHGYIIGVAVVRTLNTYSDGVDKLWTRYRRFDFYDPVFQALGEQPIFKDELFARKLSATDTDRAVFGYNEAWAHYRFKHSRVTGSFAPASGDTTFAAWSYAEGFSSAPTLNYDFKRENSSKVDKTLVASTDDQYAIDLYFDLNCVRVMPVYSIPGLMDHF